MDIVSKNTGTIDLFNKESLTVYDLLYLMLIMSVGHITILLYQSSHAV